MAIKGKGKTRGGRPGTNAPRPVIVVPKKPFLARGSTRWGALALVLIGVGVTMFVAWQKQKADEERQRQGIAIEEVDRRVTLALQSVATPGAGSAISVLPEFTAQVEQFKAGEARPAAVRRDNADLPEVLGGAIEVVGGIEVPDDLRNTEHTGPWLDAQQFMVQGLRAYQVAVRIVLDATVLTGEDRTALLDRASEQIALAAEIFDYGRQKIVNIRVDLGTFDATDFNPNFPTG
ncbi:MAG: hypothetical protein WD770_05910 [Actinomycetota bacterium]